MIDSVLSELVAAFVIAITSALFATLFGKWLRFKQQTRLSDNLNRCIAFIKNGINLQNDEIRGLRNNGLFGNIDEVSDIQSFTNDHHYSVVVIVYNPDKKQEMLDLINKMRSTNIPIVFYTNHAVVDQEYLKEVNKYPKLQVSQYSLNLIGAIFTILATYNHGNK